jgi:hypothetical protein
VPRTVLQQVLPRVVIERSPDLPTRAERVAFVASWGDDSSVSLSLASMVTQLERGGYFVIVVRASESTEPLRWPEGHTHGAVIVRKPNIGYDFGSWATGMALYPRLLSAPYILLANDSLVGPFASLQPMLDDFEGGDADVWGATNTLQFSPHLQSYLLGFRDGILRDRPVRTFWRSLVDHDDKQQIIDEYEIGLSELLHVESYVTRAWIDHAQVVEPGENPVIRGWSRLIDVGFPFVKREIITNPTIVRDGHRVAETVRAAFGEDPMTWLSNTPDLEPR